MSKLTEHFRREQGVVPFNKHTPEQRAEFIGRVKVLNAVNINLGLIQDNWGYISSAIPDKKSNPKLHSQYKRMVGVLKDYMANAKMFNALIMNLLVVSQDAKERVEIFSWYNQSIIDNLLRIPVERQELALKMMESLATEKIKAESEEDYEKKMIEFGQYCLSLSQSGRKTVTKNDLKKFLNTK